MLASVDDMRERIRRKRQLKGRQVDAQALHEVRGLIGARPQEGHRRDLLIEYLHRLNDQFRCLHDYHLVALASEMKIGMAEVYEVATFYHHFEVIQGDAAAPGLTVRVCDGLSCAMAGANNLLQRLPGLLGAEVRVISAPCVGRCEQAPVAVLHQNPLPLATTESVVLAVQGGATGHPKADDNGRLDAPALAQASVTSGPSDSGVAPAYVGYQAYRASGGYALAAALTDGQ